MMSQRQAVAAVITALVNLETVARDDSGVIKLDSNQKKQVHHEVEMLFLTGQVELKGQRSGDWLRKYIPGLVNNWLRKDPDLNGNHKYKAKNPGSRAGSGDEMLKQMKLLLAQTTNDADRATIQAEIDKRIEEIKPKPQVIDVTKLPESLRRLAPAAAVAPIVRKAEQLDS